MTLIEAQKDMRKSYVGGATGAFASGIVWITAGIIALISTEQISVFVFFFGGMLIYPLSILFSKILKRSGKHNKENPLSNLALENTIILFIGLFISYCIFQIHSNWFFSIMILIIGGRYLIFSSIYGMKVYWVFGGVLILVGVLGILFSKHFYLIGIIGGIIEIIFSFAIMYYEKKIK